MNITDLIDKLPPEAILNMPLKLRALCIERKLTKRVCDIIADLSYAINFFDRLPLEFGCVQPIELIFKRCFAADSETIGPRYKNKEVQRAVALLRGLIQERGWDFTEMEKRI